MEFTVSLLKKREEARDTKTFFFSRPASFSYVAGQYVYLTIPGLANDPRGDTRHFTLSSSPTEKNLSITVRLREESVYKQALDGLKIGDTLKLRGPNGFFFLNDIDPEHGSGQQIMIAGGIGVTPFRSIIKWVSDKSLPVPIHLICSNSIPEEIAFKKEFDGIVKTHKNIQVTYTVTHPEDSKVKWNGPTGRIDGLFLRNFLKSNLYPLTSIFWVCGPPAMTTAVEETLEKMGAVNIREEKFTGY